MTILVLIILNKLISELNALNKKQVNTSLKHQAEIDKIINNMNNHSSQEEIQKYSKEIKASIDKYNEERNNIKKELQSDRAIKYMDNCIARNKLKFER